jgi:hypothetical protein
MTQMNLFEGIKNLNKYKEYDERNPQIYEMFKRFTMEAVRRGRTKFSAEAVINRIRWETMIAGDDEFKINNDIKPYYSRKFMSEFPKLEGFFQVRRSKVDEDADIYR